MLTLQPSKKQLQSTTFSVLQTYTLCLRAAAMGVQLLSKH